MDPADLLAHASGFSWDEALLVMAPLVLIGGLLWLANRRAGRLRDDSAADEPGPDTGPVARSGDRSDDAPPAR